MGNPNQRESSKETLRSLGIALALAVFFFVWGLTIFFTVGEKGPPSWDFGIVQDIPGESPYSTHRIKEVADLTPLPVPSKIFVDKQHVDEPSGEAGVIEEKRQ
jgi:hypothetical protein